MASVRLGDRPHHDGSTAHVASGPRQIGDRVRLSVLVPSASRVSSVTMRTLVDGEPETFPASLVATGVDGDRFEVDLTITQPVQRYRFFLGGGVLGYAWLNDAGLWSHEVNDDADFRLTTADAPPAWVTSTVGYQIFPDRFAPSGVDRPSPEWARAAAWNEPIDTQGRTGVFQWYGGDLTGIEERLAHLVDLGVTLLYVTPFFPAESNHRYDATTFDRVDPVLGGDDALRSLIRQCHAHGIRVIGDLTLNHTGRRHEWFIAAQRDLSSTEASMYYFGDGPADYVAWKGVPSLPKLNFTSEALRQRLFDDDGVVARWLTPTGPNADDALDGWRIDCANTTARLGAVDLTHDVARQTRAAMSAAQPDHWLVAEHCYDAKDDLAGDGWHGVMAYQWVTRPLWGWLGQGERLATMGTTPRSSLNGVTAAAVLQTLAAGVPWPARLASMTVLDSHDTARFRTVVDGDEARHLVGLGMLMALPGVPTLFAGSELGVTGAHMDACRVPFPWDSAWPIEFLDRVRALIALRLDQPALQRGGLRFLSATDESITLLRRTGTDSVVVHATTHECAVSLDPSWWGGATLLDVNPAVHSGSHQWDGSTISAAAAAISFWTVG
jgi:alpha-glucosidase